GPAILDATAELLRGLQQANGFQPEDVESAIFTSSPDLTAEYPARAARLLGWSDVPLLGAAEVAVPDGVPRCIRVLLHFYPADAPASRPPPTARSTAKGTACHPSWWIGTARTSWCSCSRPASSGCARTCWTGSTPPSRPRGSCFATTPRCGATRGCRSR